jgi:hypothetical protein
MKHVMHQPRRRAWQHALAALLLPLLLAACGGGGSSAPPEQPAVVARLQITPGSALITGGAGATQQLSAQVFDTNGDALDVPVSWSSSRPDQLAIGAGGLLTAQAAVGSAQITATAGGVSSAPLLALAAVPAPGVVVVDDTNLVGDVVDTDTNAEPSADNTYQVTLAGVPAPAVGTLMLGRGDKPLAGRVAASTSMGAQTLVTLQLVPLDELFADLRIDEVIDLSRGEVELPADVLARFDVVREGNTWRFTPKPGATTTTSTREQRTSFSGTVDLLPFRDCKFTFADVGSPPVSVNSPSFTLTVNPTLDAAYSSAGGLERLVVGASPQVSFGANLKATAKLSGDLKCKLELLSFPVPIGGALSMFIGGKVPVGVGFEWSASTEFASFTAGARADARADARAGIECIAPAGCGFVHDISNDDLTVTPVVELPGIGDQRLASKLKVFGYLEGEFGSPLLRSLRFKAFEARVGGTLDGKFAPPVVQVLDAAFAADYKALLYGSAQVSTGIDALIRTLSLGSLRKLGLERDTPLAGTPKLLSAAADRASFALGDTVNVSVQLDAATLDFVAGLYNVESVELRRSFSGITTVVAAQTAAPGQSRFDFNVIAPHAGDVADWHVFVTTRLLPFELLSLELGRAAVHGVEVLLLRGQAAAGRECLARAEEFYLDGITPNIEAQVTRDEVDPSRCEVMAGSARATSSASASASGPALDDSIEAPRPIATLTAAGSISVNATGDVPGGSLTTGWASRSSALAEADGDWELRVQGQAVTMTITGSINNGFFEADWFPSAAGAGAHGGYRLSGDEEVGASGTLSHSVRLEPGQSVRIQVDTHRTGGDARASTEYDPGRTDNRLHDSQSASASWSLAVTFTP